MATTENALVEATTASETSNLSLTPIAPSGDLIIERATVRSYWKWTVVKVKNKKTGVVTEKQKAKFIAKVGSDDQANWKKIEEEKDKDGNPVWNFFSENSFNKYTVKSTDAFNHLVVEEEQRAYVQNSGVNYVQNSKMNMLAVEEKDGTGVNGIPPEPLHNQEDIDLASYINEKPGRRAKTIEEKVAEMLAKSGMPADRIAMILATMQASYAAAAASGTAITTEEDEEEEEGEEETAEAGN